MDLEEQNKFAGELDEFLLRKIKGEPFHFIIAIGDNYDNGFTYSVGSLSKRTAFETCDLIVVGVFEEAKQLLNYFRIPSNKKIKKPLEPK